MDYYKLSSNIEPNKVFIVNRSEIEGRLDAEYYRPEIRNLENKIRTLSSKRLRNFICKISSGATPSVKEEEKFYSEPENGIPFLRVQNLQTNGTISLTDVKYINAQTHENYLKRSQVEEYDLLVKITGVGRMAIASVAPAGFVGNTNQHMVVIRTENKEISEYLANYLNLDIIEKLASRRSTGATRPALDYFALKSIPIIDGINFAAIQEAEKIRKEKEAQAQALLDSIDDYLLNELGIALPKKDNGLKSRIFIVNFSKVSGNKWNPIFFKNRDQKIEGGIFPNYRLKELASIEKGQSITKKQIIEGNYPVIAGGQSSPYNHNKYNSIGNCITISASGAYAGYVWYHINPIFASDCSLVKSLDENLISTFFLSEMLKLKQSEIYLLQQGAGQPHVYPNDIMKLSIPIPPIEKQTEMVSYITDIRDRASQLRQEAQDLIDKVKQDVETLILGK